MAELAAGRNVSDRLMSPLWAAAPLLTLIAAIMAGVLLLLLDFPSMGLIILIGLIAALVLFIYLNYLLIDRMNRHLAREMALRRALIDFSWTKGQELGATEAMQPYIDALESIDRGSLMVDKPRSTLWSLAILVPIIGVVLHIYMLYFLSRFAFEHDDRWHAFAYNVHLASRVSGENVPPPVPRFPQDRSFILYLVITIIFGPFMIFWYLKLIEDPNEHFREQWAFEDGFLIGTGK